MAVSVSGQVRVFLLSVLLGMLCVLLFDVFAVMRKRYGKNTVIINVIDGIYFLLAFLVVWYGGIKNNFGAIRYYQIIGILLGIGLHVLLFSKIERRVIAWLWQFFATVLRCAVRLLYKPCLFLLRVFASVTVFSEDKLIKLGKKCAKVREKHRLKKKKIKKTVKKRMKMM